MKTLRYFYLVIGSALLIGITGCQQAKPDPELANIALLRGDVILCSGQELGEVSFGLSCRYSVRETFDLAVSLLHSFEYDEAEKMFVKVIDADPHCAMAYWGVAMSIYHTLWAPPGAEQLEKGEKLLKIAEAIPTTEREQDYLDAIGAYYQDWQTVDAKTRALKMTEKMEKLYTKYEDDTEAAIFYALALNSIADPTDKTLANQRKAGQILEAIFPDQPNHPGIAHYIIHSYDYPALAERALPTARKYAQIAPASAHAQHMPSHIFTRLGLWEEAIDANLNSMASAVCYAESAGIDGHWDEEFHGMDYVVYAYLQKGDNLNARRQADYLNNIDKIHPVNFKVAYALAAIPARIVLENKDWKAAANLELSSLEIPWEQFPWQKSIFHFTRALGAAHLGDIAQAEKEIALLQALHQQLLAKEAAYEADQVLIQLKTARAWLNQAEGKNAEALALMREAADMEDRTTKHPVTPGEVIPARELLGDLLLALNYPEEALTAYQADLAGHPNRFNGLYGAAVASKQLGRQEEARQYFEKLIQLAGSAEASRSELAVARAAIESMQQ